VFRAVLVRRTDELDGRYQRPTAGVVEYEDLILVLIAQIAVDG